ncbi:NADPH:quinone oxidoreductase family protein [Colwellia demingiae]|uniref:NADPH:quinone oxidoreductase family protein n=1 Tax=Colwellia demingiae TaxID=89401 RepID=A0A5C6QHB3_9GAMM|nr:NADPH:quinone oxidoreductase family protein [Colwellia demingiae]TWX68118.1 NADPH:quinone oxidoreductase family protein [Colwellia demingiae]
MKAVVCNEFGPVENLEYKDMPVPTLKKGQVLVKVEAAGINFPDGLLIQGLYQMKPPTPFVPGAEFSGVISELGQGVSHLNIGQRVIGLSMLNGFAEQVVVDATNVFPIPEQISFEEAAGLVTAHATAHYGLKQRANVKAGETVLVTGAAGGTGLAAVQIAKAMGAKVIAVCSTEEKLQVAKDNGADVLINYKDVDLKSQLKELTGGKGVDVVYECVGGETFGACARNMAWNGRLLVVGFACGVIPKFAVNLALVKGFSVIGVFWGAFTQHQPKDFIANMHELLTWYVKGYVKVVVDEVFPLVNAADAINKVLSRNVKGKVILKP